MTQSEFLELLDPLIPWLSVAVCALLIPWWLANRIYGHA
jgi:hypothetical protein